MVSLAVGVLGGSGVFHLIPSVSNFEIMYPDSQNFFLSPML